jgi:TusA-related sulfurtransferase
MLIYDRTVDLRGLPNPEPILGLTQAAGSFEDGDIVLVISDDPCFANDLIRWAGGTDLDVVSLRYPAGDLTEVVLRRPGRGRLPLPI